MPAHGQLNRIGNRLTTGQRRAHPLMSHRNPIRHRDCGEFPRGSCGMFHTDLSGLGLAVERNITGCCLVPTGGNAHKRLCDFFGCHAHRIIKGAVRRTRRTDRHMAAGQIGFVEDRLIHCETLYVKLCRCLSASQGWDKGEGQPSFAYHCVSRWPAPPARSILP